MLAALLLRPRHGKKDWFTWILDLLLGWFFRAFNLGVRSSTSAYVGVVGKLLRVPVIVLVVYGGLLYLTYWGYQQLPSGFIPAQDKGYLVASVQLPDATSAERTSQTMAKIEQIVKETPGVKNVNSVAGNSFLLSAYGSSFGSMFIILENFDERRTPERTADGIIAILRKRLAEEVPDALVNVFPPPAVSGLGRAGGFKLMVEDRGDLGLVELQRQTDNLVAKGNETTGLVGLFTVYKVDSPQLYVDVDRKACLQQGISLGELFDALQSYLGSRYVNDFNRFGRTWQVIVQADTKFRDQIEDVRKLRVRNSAGDMVPLGTLASVSPVGRPARADALQHVPGRGDQRQHGPRSQLRPGDRGI